MAGLAAVDMTLKRFDLRLRWSPEVADGRAVQPGEQLGLIYGPARGILAAERVVLNLLGRLSGVPTLSGSTSRPWRAQKAGIMTPEKLPPAGDGWKNMPSAAAAAGTIAAGCSTPS